MNKYIIPICDLISAEIFTKKIIARNLLDCQEKIMQYFGERYDIDEFADYRDFVDGMDTKNNIAIGDIIDIETL